MKKILIIEDDQVSARAYRTRLEKEGFEVHVAMDGQSGWDQLLDLRPDAVLLDLMLPKISGIELIRKIRSLDEFKALPVMVYTNRFIPRLVEDARAAGATEIFNKASVTASMLIQALRGALGLTSDGPPAA